MISWNCFTVLVVDSDDLIDVKKHKIHFSSNQPAWHVLIMFSPAVHQQHMWWHFGSFSVENRRYLFFSLTTCAFCTWHELLLSKHLSSPAAFKCKKLFQWNLCQSYTFEIPKADFYCDIQVLRHSRCIVNTSKHTIKWTFLVRFFSSELTQVFFW